MTQNGYYVDVAVTADGEFLVLMHDKILNFHSAKDPKDFISQLNVKTQRCISKTTPLDDQTADDVTMDAIRHMEKKSRELSPGTQIVVRADQVKNTKTTTVYQEVDEDGHAVNRGAGKIGSIYIKTKYLGRDIPGSITIHVSETPECT